MSGDPFALLKAAIDRLETAWAEGNLGAVLAAEEERFVRAVGCDIVFAYHELAHDRGLGPSAFRKRAVYGLVDRVRRALRQPRYWFVAEGATRPPATVSPTAPAAAASLTVGAAGSEDGDTSPGEAGPAPVPPRFGPLRAFLPAGGDVALRMDQVLGARQWEIGFRCTEPGLARHLEASALHDTRRRLAFNLRDLRKVERGAHPEWMEEHPHVVAAELACRFEQLMIDILNEHAAVARHATLLEDLTEKTDLRVSFPGLRRRRGARVQVTSILNPHELRAKIDKIVHAEELVILSPLTMAEAWGRGSVEGTLSAVDRDAFWRCLPSRPASDHELARELNRMFFRALNAAEHNLADPRGPMALVPEAVRRFVQAYVRGEALRTTDTMRHNQRNGLLVLRRRRAFGRRHRKA